MRKTSWLLLLTLLISVPAQAAPGGDGTACATLIADAEMLTFFEADTIPRDFVVVFTDAKSGQDRGLTFMRSEVVNGEQQLVFRGDYDWATETFSEIRIRPEDLIKEGKPGTFSLQRPGSEPLSASDVKSQPGSGTQAKETKSEPAELAPENGERRARHRDVTGVGGLGGRGRANAKRRENAPPTVDHQDASEDIVAGDPIHYPAMDRVHLRRQGETAVSRIEDVIGKKLDNLLGAGGTRQTFEDPRDAEWTLKILDPGQAIDGSPISEEMMMRLMRAELGSYVTLKKAGFRIPDIDFSPEAQALWKFGCVRQKNLYKFAKGTPRPYMEVVPKNYRPGMMPGLDKFHERLRKYDEPLAKSLGKKLKLIRRVRHGGKGSPPVQIGIDVGSRYNNVFMDDLPEPILLDF